MIGESPILAVAGERDHLIAGDFDSKERAYAMGQVPGPGGTDDRSGGLRAPVRRRRPFAYADGHASGAERHPLADSGRQPQSLAYRDGYGHADGDFHAGPADGDFHADPTADVNAGRPATRHAAPAPAHAAAGDSSGSHGRCRRWQRYGRRSAAAPAR